MHLLCQLENYLYLIVFIGFIKTPSTLLKIYLNFDHTKNEHRLKF